MDKFYGGLRLTFKARLLGLPGLRIKLELVFNVKVYD
jgi:hypothetical protein